MSLHLALCFVNYYGSRFIVLWILGSELITTQILGSALIILTILGLAFIITTILGSALILVMCALLPILSNIETSERVLRGRVIVVSRTRYINCFGYDSICFIHIYKVRQ